MCGVEADGRRADEGAGFDRDAGALRYFGDGADVVLVRARGAVRANLQFLFDDLAREIVEQKLKIRPNCAARTHENDIRPIAEISQRAGIPIEACTRSEEHTPQL